MLRLLGSAVILGPFVRRVFHRFRGVVKIDGAPIEWPDFVTIGAATVREVGLGFKLIHRADDDPERLGVIAIHAGPLSLIPDFPAVHAGRGVAPSRAFSAVASTVEIEPVEDVMAYTIDGDLYRKTGPLRISLGPHIEFIKPQRGLISGGQERYDTESMSSSFPLDGMRVRFAGETNVGMKRAHNEDSFYLPESERLAIVADGMGGHASGEVASRMAVETIAGFFRATQDEQQLTWPFKMDRGHRYDVNRMVTAIKLANLKIHEQAQKDPQCHGMGTTVVATLFADDALIVGHVGDSRLYRRRDGRFEQITEDHSLLNDYIKIKHLSPEEIANFPHKNVIVRALGMKDSVQVDVHIDNPRLGDVYVLCSDGLSGMVKDQEISDVVVARARPGRRAAIG